MAAQCEKIRRRTIARPRQSDACFALPSCGERKNRSGWRKFMGGNEDMLRIFAAALIAAPLAMVPGGAIAQNSLKIVVPYTPGSGPDITSRLMGEAIGKAHNVNVVVENKPGAGTVIGTELAARSEPDGNTVVMIANTFVINPKVGRGNYTIEGSFEPVCQLAATPMVLVVQGKSPIKTLQDLVKEAKAGKVVFASGGPASSLHIAIEILKLEQKLDSSYVPYGGTAPAINALMGGHVQAVWADYPTVVGHLKSGTLRALVTTSTGKLDALPGVPTLNSTGLAKHEADIFYGVMAPKKTPDAALKRLSGWFSAAVKSPDVTPKLAKQGLFPAVKCGAEFSKFLENLSNDYGRVVKEAGIKVK
jgi:tripartite-type tricarboxylate transporter receptor subunit TctC